MREIGLKTKLTEKDATLTTMEQSTKEIGSRISSTDQEWRLGLTMQGTKDNTKTEKNTVTACSSGPMDLVTQVNSLTTTSMASVHFFILIN